MKIKHRDLGGNGAEAYYTEHPRPALLAVAPDLDPTLQEGRELEAEGYYRKRPPKGGRKFCFKQRHPYDFDPNAINAIRCIVDDLRPSWVEEVKDACRISNDPHWISAYLDMSPQVVVAIVENLIARGELPERIEWGA